MSDTHYVTVTCPNCRASLDVNVYTDYDMSYGDAEVSELPLPLVGDVNNDSAMPTRKREDPERES